MENVEMFGATGPLAFGPNGDRYGIKLKIEQQIDGVMKTVGVYDTLNDTLNWLSSDRLTFRGPDPRAPPRDSVMKYKELRSVSWELFLTLSVLAICGIAFALVMLVINIKNRHEKVIKMSSPRVNNIIAVGCILCYTSVVAFGIDRNVVKSDDGLIVVCACRAWLLSMGFTMAFGGLFSKTWRVYAIFTSKDKNKRVIIRDEHLYGLITAFMVIDVAILISWQVVDPLVPRLVELPEEVNKENDLVIQPMSEGCQSSSQYKFLGMIYGYNGLLLIIGAFLSIETRFERFQQPCGFALVLLNASDAL
ncbi:PREDICTED: gamma-aminobutyric acid type B receptor subunit 2-like [Priapulus caudatus]|uniref:Gamma-aminobutyric acid type B receptor subunit 2-like n=1 Tax=Priapulus caudatus TaxID=37621 RepID=A0ABM1ES02_PRICU|nr:PREDICTED: gamma-aminobutyric acid type B receptor subunit 2-like [Priapulus caudatus]